MDLIKRYWKMLKWLIGFKYAYDYTFVDSTNQWLITNRLRLCTAIGRDINYYSILAAHINKRDLVDINLRKLTLEKAIKYENTSSYQRINYSHDKSRYKISK